MRCCFLVPAEEKISARNPNDYPSDFYGAVRFGKFCSKTGFPALIRSQEPAPQALVPAINVVPAVLMIWYRDL